MFIREASDLRVEVLPLTFESIVCLMCDSNMLTSILQCQSFACFPSLFITVNAFDLLYPLVFTMKIQL